MSDEDYRALLNLWLCSISWPASEREYSVLKSLITFEDAVAMDREGR